MAGVAHPLRHGQIREAGDAQPAPRAAWEVEGGEGVGGACSGARNLPRRDEEEEAGTRYRIASAACAAAGSRWRPSRASFSRARESQRRERRSARAKDAVRVGNGGGRRGGGGGLCVHTWHAADPRTGDSTGPPKGASAMGGGPLAAGLRPSPQRESESGAGRARHPTECPLCVLGWESDGVCRARAVRHEAKKRRAREGATRQVPPHVASRGRRPPVGPLGLLTQGGACQRTHVCEQGPPDEQVRGARA